MIKPVVSEYIGWYTARRRSSLATRTTADSSWARLRASSAMPCLVGSNRWTLVRPWRFPAYSAASAWWMIWWRSVLGPGKAEIPIVTENAPVRPWFPLSADARRWFAMNSALSASQPGSSNANSSPPVR